jgi:hypothetical protein
VSSSTAGYCHEIFVPQPRQRPRSARKENSGMFSQAESCRAHFGQMRHVPQHVHAEHAFPPQHADVVIERVRRIAVDLEVARPDQRMHTLVVGWRLCPADQVHCRIAGFLTIGVILSLARADIVEHLVVIGSRSVVVRDIAAVVPGDHCSPAIVEHGLAGGQYQSQDIVGGVRRVAP